VQPDFSQIVPYLLAVLVVYAIYRRFRRSFGRQALRPARMMLRIALLSVVACVLAPMALRSGQFLAAVFIGAALGIGLGVWGAQRTRFQMVGAQLHYVPHTYTGIAVSLLFLGRLVFRLSQAYSGLHAAHATAAGAAQGYAPASMLRSPLTVGIFFVLVGYYVYFYSWLLWKSKRLNPGDIEAASAAAAP